VFEISKRPFELTSFCGLAPLGVAMKRTGLIGGVGHNRAGDAEKSFTALDEYDLWPAPGKPNQTMTRNAGAGTLIVQRGAGNEEVRRGEER
jgi:hypothetical protein